MGLEVLRTQSLHELKRPFTGPFFTINFPGKFMMNNIFKNFLFLFICLSWSHWVSAAEPIKPFILGSITSGELAQKVAESKQVLEKAGFKVVGEYVPYDSVHIIIVTNDDLLKAAATHERAGYVAAQRVSFTLLNGKVQVAYTNPAYMAAAYRVKSDLASVSSKLAEALGNEKAFGADPGMTAEDLNEYHYMVTMEYFDDQDDLANYDSYDEAIKNVEKGLETNTFKVSKVYRIDIPGVKQTLVGVGLTRPKNGNPYMDDEYIMSEIDFKDIRSSAHLPYEILIKGNKVEALNARFRIAINFPDLKMVGDNSFLNIMPTPDAITEVLTKTAGGEWEESF